MNAHGKNHFRAVQLEQKSLLLAHESTLVGSLSIPEMHNSARSCASTTMTNSTRNCQRGHDEKVHGNELP